MKISVIGCGYVGLVSGVCFADSGHTVTCIDNDNKKIQLLKDNQVPIYEPGLNELLLKNIKGNNLHFELNINENIKDSEIVLITVGTPTDENGDADLTFVRQCANEIAEFISPNTIVIIKSTVPVGTCDEIEDIINEKCAHSEFSVISNPEFLREGNAIYDFINPDRIVIGIKDQTNKRIMINLYKNISNEDKILFTSRRSSELIKYASNSMLAMRIIFINEIADLCEKDWCGCN